MPPESGISFVVVLHLPADRHSILVIVVARKLRRR